MSTETAADPTPAEPAHNHASRCCCPLLKGSEDEYRVCPACPEHGDLAEGVECPQCHQPAGRPHTDYCPLQLARDPWATTNREYPGQPHIQTLEERPADNPAPVPNCDGRGCGGQPHE